MLGSITRSDSVHVGSVRCRRGRDALRERRCFEAAMGDVTGAGIGLPTRALLFVRRVAPTAPLRGSKADRFVDAVQGELSRKLREARRPWLQGDAASAEAVLFADEAELAACLIRDWLQGRATERWWWKQIPGTTAVSEWWRRQVIARGEMFAAVTETLSASGHAIEWYARLEVAHIVQARAALDAAYGISGATPAEAVVAAARAGPESVPARDTDASRLSFDAAALQTLLAVAPEIASSTLSIERRILLATVLVVRRRLDWARSPEFAKALRELHDEVLVAERVVRAALLPLKAATAESTAPPTGMWADPSISIAPPERAISDRGLVLAAGSERSRDTVVSAPALRQSAQAEKSLRVPSMAVPEYENPAPPSSPTSKDRSQPGTESRATATPGERALDPVAIRSAEAIAPHVPTSAVDPPLRPAVKTKFGGIFYLLNVALALGYYGDFTAPRHRGLEISPWDWLAAIGRRWFGAEFRKDPVWKVLADLAGHPPRRRPERGFKMADLSEQLITRLMQALGTDDRRQVPNRVCRYPAHIYKSASQVDVHLSLDDLPIELRIAGLDRDPGWIPAAGQSVRFHFQ